MHILVQMFLANRSCSLFQLSRRESQAAVDFFPTAAMLQLHFFVRRAETMPFWKSGRRTSSGIAMQPHRCNPSRSPRVCRIGRARRRVPKLTLYRHRSTGATPTRKRLLNTRPSNMLSCTPAAANALATAADMNAVSESARQPAATALRSPAFRTLAVETQAQKPPKTEPTQHAFSSSGATESQSNRPLPRLCFLANLLYSDVQLPRRTQDASASPNLSRGVPSALKFSSFEHPSPGRPYCRHGYSSLRI